MGLTIITSNSSHSSVVSSCPRRHLTSGDEHPDDESESAHPSASKFIYRYTFWPGMAGKMA